MTIKPIYPKFARVTLKHKRLVDNVTKKFSPYCDFNFQGMYYWSDPKSPTQISFLNNNLVIKMKDFTKNTVVMVLCDREYRFDEVVRERSTFEKNLDGINNDI